MEFVKRFDQIYKKKLNIPTILKKDKNENFFTKFSRSLEEKLGYKNKQNDVGKDINNE